MENNRSQSWSEKLSLLDNSHSKYKAQQSKLKNNSYTRASFYQRASAWCWDLIIFQIMHFLLVKVVINSHTSVVNSLLYSFLIYVGLFIAYGAYHILMEYQFHTTLGKYFVGLKVIHNHIVSNNIKNNEPFKILIKERSFKNLHPKNYLYRSAIRFLSSGLSWATFNIGHYMIKWRKDRLSLHDIISETQVIYDEDIQIKTIYCELPCLSNKVHQWLFYFGFVAQILIFIVSLILMVFKIDLDINQIMSHVVV